MSILVLGAYGLLGSHLCISLLEEGNKVFRQGSSVNAELSFLPYLNDELLKVVKKKKPKVIINLIALTNVDQCEQDPKLAYILNVRTVEKIVEAKEYFDFHLIHISTDQVYSGLGIHKESSIKPLNVYGITKYCSEVVASKIEATIIRTNYHSKSVVPKKYSFSDWIVKSLRNRDKIKLFDDISFNAVHISFLINIIKNSIKEKYIGTFNVGCKDSTTKAKFAISLAKLLSLDYSSATIGLSNDSKLIASRPKNMVMCVNKFQKIFKIQAPTMEETLLILSKDYL